MAKCNYLTPLPFKGLILLYSMCHIHIAIKNCHYSGRENGRCLCPAKSSGREKRSAIFTHQTHFSFADLKYYCTHPRRLATVFPKTPSVSVERLKSFVFVYILIQNMTTVKQEFGVLGNKLGCLGGPEATVNAHFSHLPIQRLLFSFKSDWLTRSSSGSLL